ncbi:hypothetical protein PGTUg99_034282 [Puccinia graminis f. sp. tritici]|uniref:Uncharacterized protein n=1 Tax=Puccinia graminis f. sp. tritici TaxID=56615 RepID=A0A5B0PPW8_PUCGR|nr:hypothetical protein PGTUg99_034282 [Puccinia graminis f. sp. tritici]
MSSNTQVRPAHQSSSPLPGAPPNDSVCAAMSIPLDCQSSLDRSQPNHPNQADSLGSILPEKSTAVDSQANLVNPYISRAGSTPLDAEFRVHQEIFKALPASSSPSLCAESTTSSDDTSSRSSQYDVPDDGSTRMFQLDKELPSSKDSLQDDSSVFESTLGDLDDPSDDILSRLFQDKVGQAMSEESFYENSSVYEDSSVFEFALGQLDDLPVPTQGVDRDRPIEFVTLAYEDIFFIQKELVSSAQSRRQSGAEAQVFDHPTETLSPSRIQSYEHMLSSHQPRSNLAISPSFVSAVESHSSRSSQDPASCFLSPRSSALQQRLDQAKAAARIRSSCNGVTPPQPSNKPLSLERTSLRENRNVHNQVLSPSSSDGPDVLCFPLTPPIYPIARSPQVGHSYIPLSFASADLDTFGSDSVNGQSTQTCPSNFNLRTRRPIVTSILFQDVEAQAFAANAALRKTRTLDAEGQPDFKKTLPRKKSISTAHIGAPKLVSTSAFLPGLQLDARVREVEGWHAPTPQSKSILKGGFKLKINKKKSSETGPNQQTANTPAHDQSRHIKLFPSNSNLRQDVCRPNFNSTSLYAGDSAIVPSTQTKRRGSLDQPGSPTSPKHTLALNSFRKLVNTVTAFKLNHVSGNPINSVSTVSEVAPDRQLSQPILREHVIGPTDTVYEEVPASPNATGHDPFGASAGLVARLQDNNHHMSLGPVAMPEARGSDEYQRQNPHNSIIDLYGRNSHLPPREILLPQSQPLHSLT